MNVEFLHIILLNRIRIGLSNDYSFLHLKLTFIILFELRYLFLIYNQSTCLYFNINDNLVTGHRKDKIQCTFRRQRSSGLTTQIILCREVPIFLIITILPVLRVLLNV